MELSFSWTPAAADLVGHYSNATGVGPFTMTATSAGDGLSHQVTLRNDSANSKAAITFTLTGTDCYGRAQTEAMAGPGGSTTVTSTKFFATLTSVSVSATLGADTVDVGWAATSVSHPIMLPAEASALPAFQTVITGTINYDLASTLMNPQSSAFTNAHDATFANDANFTAKTASVSPAALAVRARAVRLEVNTITAGATVKLYGVSPEK